MVSKIENFITTNQKGDPYNFEKGMASILRESCHSLFQASLGPVPRGVNSKVNIKTSFGEMTVPKTHPMSTRPLGFHASPYLLEHMCRLGSKLVFSEASEEFWEFLEIPVPDKLIERVCHSFGERIDEIDWENAYSDSVQKKISFQPQEHIYVMVDGSLLLTREKKEKWKEIKLGRVFGNNSLVEVSKGRGVLTNSVYMAHFGNSDEFWEKFSAEIPASQNLVFIGDGAKWIWKYIKERYPNSILILDFFHCKEHICKLAKEFFRASQKASEFIDSVCQKLLSGKVKEAVDQIDSLESNVKSKKEQKEKLLNYLKNNEDRIDYGKFQEMGLLIGSGPIESAQRNVIQKRLKLSGQRWTIKGAQQIANLRVAKKSNHWDKVLDCINEESEKFKNAA